MICGGVAISRGDFLWTMMVLRCLEEAEYPEAVDGENAATVEAFASQVGGEAGPFDCVVLDISESQGVSTCRLVRKRARKGMPARTKGGHRLRPSMSSSVFGRAACGAYGHATCFRYLCSDGQEVFLPG